MTPQQELRLQGILASVYIDASSRLEFPEVFAAQLQEALRDSGFRIVPDIHVYPSSPLPPVEHLMVEAAE
jgi:hypothetical protein